jgi:hypothetical protein
MFALEAAGGFDPLTAQANPIITRLTFAITFPVPLLLFLASFYFNLMFIFNFFLLCVKIGLVMILLVGGELFTGNIMYMTVALASRQITVVDLLKNWALSLLGNFIGYLMHCFLSSFISFCFRYSSF